MVFQCIFIKTRIAPIPWVKQKSGLFWCILQIKRVGGNNGVFSQGSFANEGVNGLDDF